MEAEPTERAMNRVTGMATVGVAGTDQDRALAFYVDILGLEKRLAAGPANLGEQLAPQGPEEVAG
jgi:catechol 2,3-dioxygenase-like lactoylglutathione lyase family enzyme